ncbi:MAG: Glycosyl transferase family 11 [Candidatus Roizmanbacteria bacterium GW2011_GWA2_32_13]|uniref:Glycosyl transferase family 11 n=1 Tax=Candidatus Roizmanbacteria bacterium GW2011_GWA2_32_13 TaxID=1618475 RepID=A0A0G0C1E1_9BACT|nr:MAG: Glycosyl transferase family 11 [Candidatus Roizmanbacteria bacterium GW2011_GWA2_32_13]
MIIIRLSGGLGNQLFQYALAVSLRERGGLDITIDPHFLFSPQEGVTRRSYVLDKFNVSFGITTDEDIKKLGVPRLEDERILSKIKRKLIKIIDWVKPFHKKKIIVAKDSQSFDPRILKIEGESYLAGNWASPKYFSQAEKNILKDITLKGPMSIKALAILDNIQDKDLCAVSLHIRRGDHSGVYSSKIGAIPISFYQEAMRIIEKKESTRCFFFIFTDDVEYVKDNLSLNEKFIFVSKNGVPDYEELILMTKCKHNIISNSTFSWWGAWLNQNPDKMVIAPKIQRTDGKNTSDYIPEELGWIRI